MEPLDSKFEIQNSEGMLGPRLAKDAYERTCGRELRAFAGRSCGPLRFHSEPQIQNEELKMKN